MIGLASSQLSTPTRVPRPEPVSNGVSHTVLTELHQRSHALAHPQGALSFIAQRIGAPRSRGRRRFGSGWRVNEALLRGSPRQTPALLLLPLKANNGTSLRTRYAKFALSAHLVVVAIHC